MRTLTKAIALLTIFCSSFLNNAYSQNVPIGINYQAIARDAGGQPIPSTSVNVRITIRQTTAAGPIVFQETHNPLTNTFGLVNFVIGNGTPLVGTLAGVDFSSDAHFIQTEVFNAGWVDLGTAELQSTPYSLVAKNALSLNGDSISSNSPGDGDILVYNTTNQAWEPTASGGAGWGLSGNAISPGEFIGTTNDETVFIKRQNAVIAKFSDTTNIWGIDNTGIGTYSFAIGTWNRADGHRSFAIGNYANALHLGSMVLGDWSGSSPATTQSSSNDQFTSRFNGGYRFYSSSDLDVLNGMFWNDGELGIGIASPESNIHIRTASSSTIRLTTDVLGNGSLDGLNIYMSGTNCGFLNRENVPMYFGNNATNDVIITATGEVGIGDMSPLATLTVGNGDKFQVNGTTGTVRFSDAFASIDYPNSAVGSPAMINMFSSGFTNVDRMVISHSPPEPLWGLEYEDNDDKFHFRRNTGRMITMDLTNGRIGIDQENPTASLEVNGYTKLGSEPEAYPIKMKVFEGNCAATEGGNVSFPHGINSSRLVSISAVVEYSPGNFVPDEYSIQTGYCVSVICNATNIVVVNHQMSGNRSNQILNDPFKVTILYRD